MPTWHPHRQRQALKAIRHDSLARRTMFLQRFISVSQCKNLKPNSVQGTSAYILSIGAGSCKWSLVQKTLQFDTTGTVGFSRVSALSHALNIHIVKVSANLVLFAFVHRLSAFDQRWFLQMVVAGAKIMIIRYCWYGSLLPSERFLPRA